MKIASILGLIGAVIGLFVSLQVHNDPEGECRKKTFECGGTYVIMIIFLVVGFIIGLFIEFLTRIF